MVYFFLWRVILNSPLCLPAEYVKFEELLPHKQLSRLVQHKNNETEDERQEKERSRYRPRVKERVEDGHEDDDQHEADAGHVGD